MYGPRNARSFDCIQVKLCTGQHTAVTKNNINVSSMSGKVCIFFSELVSSDKLRWDSGRVVAFGKTPGACEGC